MSTDNTDCGCCAGIATDTPAAKFNRAGLPAIAYRVGTHPDFKADASRAPVEHRLSGARAAHHARATTTTRSRCATAFAVLADVLTFYQERIANESYLAHRTRASLGAELARLIGYQLAPGVAAGTSLAFTLEAAPGAPALAAQPVTVPVGTRVQSVPDPDQEPQTFETIAPITARVEWNAISVAALAAGRGPDRADRALSCRHHHAACSPATHS